MKARTQAFVVILGWVLVSLRGAYADVWVVPAAPTAADSITLVVTGEWPTSGYRLDRTTQSVSGDTIHVDMYWTAPTGFVLQVITPYREEVSLRSLSAGTYRAVVNVYRGATQVDTQECTFTVSGSGATPGDGICPVAGTSCLSFDGVDDYVNLGNRASLQLTGSMTIGVWVQLAPGNAGQYLGIAGKLSNSGSLSYRGYGLVRHETNYFRFVAGPGTTTLNVVSSAQQYTDTEWHHVAGMMTGGVMKLYVDGVLSAQSGAGQTMADSGQYAFLGCQYSDSSVRRYLRGMADDLRIYNRALTGAEVSTAMTTVPAGAPAGLVGYWDLNEGSGQIVHDGSGNGNQGFLGAVNTPDSADPAWMSTSTFCGNGGGTATGCLAPGSRVVLTDTAGLLPLQLPDAGTGGTVLCVNPASGQLLVSWDFWFGGDDLDLDGTCLAGLMSSSPWRSLSWVLPDQVSCHFDECGVLDVRTERMMSMSYTAVFFTYEDRANAGTSYSVLVDDPDISTDPSVASAAARGQTVRLRGLYDSNPQGDVLFPGYTGGRVRHPIIGGSTAYPSPCGAQTAPASLCCPTSHIAEGDRVVYGGAMLMSPGAPSVGTSGTVICCTGGRLIVSWDLRTDSPTGLGTCEGWGDPPLYLPSGSLSVVSCCELRLPVDLCGTVISKPSVGSNCDPYVLFRPADATLGYGDIPLYDASLQVGDEIEVRGLYGCNISDIMMPGCLRPSMLMYQAIIALGCQGGASCAVDFCQYEPSGAGLSPSSIQAGQNLHLVFGGANCGTADIPAGWRIRYYASLDTNISVSDYLLYETTADFGLAAGQQLRFTEDFLFPSGVPAGQYYIGWIFDPADEVCESNENNNAGCLQALRLIVSGGGGSCQMDFCQYLPADAGFSPSSIQAGQSFHMVFGGANCGTAGIPAGWRIRYYASLDTNITAGDHLLYETTADFGIGAGQQLRFTEDFSFPSGVPAGQYYIGWIFDPLNAVCESNENNNAGCITSARLTVGSGGGGGGGGGLVIGYGGSYIMIQPSPGSPGTYSGCLTTVVQLNFRGQLSVQVTPASPSYGTWTGWVIPDIVGPGTAQIQICVEGHNVQPPMVPPGTTVTVATIHLYVVPAP